MINLIVEKEQESVSLVKIKSLVRVVTTLILVVYVVGASAFLGWTIYQSTRSERVSAELLDLTEQVAAKSEQENYIKKLDAKAASVNDFLAKRPDAKKMTRIFIEGNVQPRSWQFDDATGLSKIEVAASASADVNEFVSYLTQSYTQVKLDKLAYSVEDNWVGMITVGGMK